MKHPHQTESLSVETLAADGCLLTVVSGPDAGRVEDLGRGPVVVGSSPDCDLQLSDPTVSAHHARFVLAPEGVVVTDLDSKNGTRHLGTRIRQATVPLGSVLVLGRSEVAAHPPRAAAAHLLSPRSGYGAIRGASLAMRQLYTVLERMEELDYTVLIEGETGVGKECVVREVHAHSVRANKPFEIFDCGAVAPQLAESELFGHVRGAFTDAVDDHRGVFERARGGTVFLDEIGDLPLELQPKLLRVLESGEFRRIGDEEVITCNARIIAATNRNLTAMVAADEFREDLYFRLAVIEIRVPPLRERRDDIPLLVRHFMEDAVPSTFELSEETLRLCTAEYDWPGNVRELKNAVAALRTIGDVPEPIAGGAAPRSGLAGTDISGPFQDARRRIMNAFEHDYIEALIRRSEGNIARAARMAKMDRSYLRRLMQRHGLLPNK